MSAQDKGFPFEVDADSNVPLWVQLRKRIIFLIESGYFKAGDQLPKIRDLAVEISINFNTVNKAYLSLQSDGYLKSIRGKGVFVTDAAARQQTAEREGVDAVIDECLRACKGLGLTYDETVSKMAVRAMALKMSEAVPAKVPGTNVIVLNSDNLDSKSGA